MENKQLKALQIRFEKLQHRNQTLRETLAGLREEKRTLERALKESRVLLEMLPGCIVLIQEGKIIFANQTVQKKMGYTEQDLRGRSFLEFVSPEAVDRMRTMHRKRLNGKPVPNQYETHLLTRDGKRIACDVRVNKIRYGARRAFVLNILDIDHRERQERVHLQTSKREALGLMATGLARTLKGCLRHLELPEERLAPGANGVPTPVKENIASTRDEGYALIQRLAALSADPPDRSAFMPIDLKKLLEDAVALAKAREREEKSAVKVNTFLRTLSPAKGHPHELREAFVQIITNSMDALKEDGEIFLTTEEDAGFACIYVQDSGSGIDEKHREKIFDPFFSTKDQKNPGLGLSIAQATILRHGGQNRSDQPGGPGGHVHDQGAPGTPQGKDKTEAFGKSHQRRPVSAHRRGEPAHGSSD